VLDCRLHGVSRDLAQLRVGGRVHHVCLRHVVRFHTGLKEVNEEWSEAGAVSVIGGGGRFLPPLNFSMINAILPAMARYFWLVLKYRSIVASPSNKGLASNPERAQSTGDFIETNSSRRGTTVWCISSDMERSKTSRPFTCFAHYSSSHNHSNHCRTAPFLRTFFLETNRRRR
jgi:hypothetical protein